MTNSSLPPRIAPVSHADLPWDHRGVLSCEEQPYAQKDAKGFSMVEATGTHTPTVTAAADYHQL